MSRDAAITSESSDLQNETARLMIRAAAVVLSVSAFLGVLAIPVTPQPGGVVALGATAIALSVAWWQTTRPRPDAFALLLIWETLTALAALFAESPVANAQTMSLFTAVFLGVFLLEGRRMWIVLCYAWVVWAFVMSRIAPGLERELVAQIAMNHVITLVIGTALMLILRRRMRLVIERAVGRFHKLPVGAFRTTAEGRVLEVNSKMVAILGYDSPDELKLHNAREFFVDEDQRAQTVAVAARDGSVQGVLLALRTKDGRHIETRGTVTTTRDASGTLVLEGIIEDVSALHVATRKAQLAEERFAIAFESAPVGMLIVGSEGEVQKANHAVHELLGLHDDRLAGSRWADLGDGSSEWEDLIREGGPGEYLISRADGGKIWVLGTSARVDDVEDSYFIVQLVDVSSQRTLQDSLKGMVRAKDEFVASVSHELRTPLTAVVGFSDMLVNDQSLDVDEKVAMQRLVHSQALSVSHIVEDLLVAARLNNGRLSVTPRLIDLGTVARRAVADCAHAAGEKASVRIEGTAEAWADPERVRQILRNLVTNAYRYGGERVSVTLSNGGPHATVEVIDDGDGIDPKDVDSIWEPYSRAHPDTSTTTDSMGLGLAVSRQLAALMQGNLAYRYENGLSVFELTLPTTSTGR